MPNWCLRIQDNILVSLNSNASLRKGFLVNVLGRSYSLHHDYPVYGSIKNGHGSMWLGLGSIF